MSRRANGGGSVVPRKLKDGKTVVYDIYYRWKDADGQPHRTLKRGFATKTAAEKALRRFTAEADLGPRVEPSRQSLKAFLWGDGPSSEPPAADAYLANPEWSQQTRLGYQRKARQYVLPYLGYKPIGNISAADLTSLYRKLGAQGGKSGKELSPKTVSEVHAILSGAFRQAVRHGVLAVNPASQAQAPTGKRIREARQKRESVPDPWTPDELRRFLTATSGERLGALWHFLASTGCRRGEALGLRWKDLDLDGGTARIVETIGCYHGKIILNPTTKGRKSRTIDLDAATVTVLRRHKRQQDEARLALGNRWKDEGLVFPRDGFRLASDKLAGGPLNADRISQAFKETCMRAGVRTIRLHDLRHTWATLALKAGVPVTVVSQRLGHESPTITLNVYSHVLSGQQREAAEQVAALYA